MPRRLHTATHLSSPVRSAAYRHRAGRSLRPDHRHGSPDIPTIAGHGLHFDSGGSEELADLRGVFKKV